MTQSVDLERLAAKAASAGPEWYVARHLSRWMEPEDAPFAEAATPAAILALTARARKAEAERDEARAEAYKLADAVIALNRSARPRGDQP